MKVTKIAPRNIMFTDLMSWKGQEIDVNMGLIMGENRNYVIDTGLGSGSVAPILEYLSHSERPTIVINTHHCFDHVWGNWVFKDSLIIAHTACVEHLKENWNQGVRRYDNLINGEVHECLPNLTFESSLYFSDDEVEIFHTPGHTKDSISIYDAVDKVLYAGDNIGDTDEEIVPRIKTDLLTFQRLLETYKQYDFDLCISGHNRPQEKEVLSRMEAALPDAWQQQSEF